MATALSKSSAGELIANNIVNVLGNNTSATMIYIILILATIILTQFLLTSTMIYIMLPITCFLSIKMGFNPYPFAVGITLAGSMGLATPIANPTISMSTCANYKFSDYIKYTGIMLIFILAVLIFVIPRLWPLVK